MISMRQITPALVLGLCLVPGLALAQVNLQNPGFHPREKAVYTVKTGSAVQKSEMEVLVRDEAGSTWIEYRSTSPESTSMVRFDPRTLAPVASEVTSTSPDSTIRRSTEYLSLSPKLKSDELFIADMASLGLVLRGFPWGKKDFARLVFAGSGPGGGDFSFELRVKGRETLKLAGTSWECWKVELSLGGMLGGLVGSTKLWFSTQAPHPLVRSEGAQGGPGSPVRVMELAEYRAGS